MKTVLIGLLFLFSATLFAQKEYYYLRIFHYNLENPAALHLQGKVSGNSGFGFGTSNNDRRLNGFYSGCYYIKALKFALQFKQNYESDYAYTTSVKAISLNKYYKIKKKGTLSFGVALKLINASLDWDKLIWADQISPTAGVRYHTNETRLVKEVFSASFDLAALYYLPIKKPFFTGIIINNITQPYLSFGNAAGPATFIPREIKIYAGQQFSIGKKEKEVVSLMYRQYINYHQLIVKSDFIYNEKYVFGLESNFSGSLKLALGYLPTKHWRAAAIVDVMPNSRSTNGNSNFITISAGYAL